MYMLGTTDPNGSAWVPGGAQEMALHAEGAGLVAWDTVVNSGTVSYVPETDIEVNFGGWTAAIAAAEATIAANAAAAQWNTLIAGGLAITSTGTPALNGTYGTDPGSEFNVVALQAATSENSALFPGYYRLANGTRITMTAAQFVEIATAILDFVKGCDDALATAQQGGMPSWPATTATIT
jgi:hypothetical protein